MDIMFSSPPTMFGFYHIAFLIGIVAVTTLLFFLLRRKDEKTLIRFIWIHGVIMILLEVWKQWFSAKYVYPGIFSMWYFPWQLCDIAMYCSFILPFVKGKVQDAILVFLSSFSLLAAIMALIVPGDMLRPQILLFMHGFIYHGMMIAESLAAILILRKRGSVRFYPAVIIFLITAVIAEIINIISYHLIDNLQHVSNMFNITPYYPSTQPVFHEIAVTVGIIPEILLYLLLIAAVSFGIFRLERIGCSKR